MCVCGGGEKGMCVCKENIKALSHTHTLKSKGKEILTFQSFQSKGWAPAWSGNKTLALLGRNLNSANL